MKKLFFSLVVVSGLIVSSAFALVDTADTVHSHAQDIESSIKQVQQSLHEGDLGAAKASADAAITGSQKLTSAVNTLKTKAQNVLGKVEDSKAAHEVIKGKAEEAKQVAQDAKDKLGNAKAALDAGNTAEAATHVDNAHDKIAELLSELQDLVTQAKTTLQKSEDIHSTVKTQGFFDWF